MDAMTLSRSITASIEELARETDQVRISETLQQYMEAMSKFHHYSLSNQLLIAIQKPEATQVAGFHTWLQKFKRQVRRGEKGIAIFAPIVTKLPKTVQDLDKEEQRSQLLPANPSCRGFKVVYVFDITQTEGEPIPAAPEWHDRERDLELEQGLYCLAHSRGIQVDVAQNLGGAQGVSSGGHIQLLDGAGTRVLVHELVHELLSHSSQEVRAVISKQQREIEADAAAFVVGRHFNLAGAAIPNYLALWQAAGPDILDCMERVREISTQIIRFLEENTKRVNLADETII